MAASIPDFLKIGSITCEIKRVTLDDDHAFGSPPGDFETIVSDVVCVLDREQSFSNRYGGGRSVDIQGVSDMASWKLMTLAATDIVSGDRVIIGGVTYDVNDVIPFSTHKECILSKHPASN